MDKAKVTIFKELYKRCDELVSMCGIGINMTDFYLADLHTFVDKKEAKKVLKKFGNKYKFHTDFFDGSTPLMLIAVASLEGRDMIEL